MRRLDVADHDVLRAQHVLAALEILLNRTRLVQYQVADLNDPFVLLRHAAR